MAGKNKTYTSEEVKEIVYAYSEAEELLREYNSKLYNQEGEVNRYFYDKMELSIARMEKLPDFFRKDRLLSNMFDNVNLLFNMAKGNLEKGVEAFAEENLPF